jgi:hypothetical protein
MANEDQKTPEPPAPPPPNGGGNRYQRFFQRGKFVLWAVVFVGIVGELVGAVHKESVELFLVGLAAMTAYFTLLLWPQRTSAWTWFVSKPVAILTAVLSLSGAAGGFAYHLVHNHGGVYLFGFQRVWVQESYGCAQSSTKEPPPLAQASASPAATAAPTASPQPEEAKIETPDVWRVEKSVFDFGFLSDVLIGMIAANALHLAISGIVKYDAPIGEDRNNVYFTLIALGILAGFSGANVLPTWAQKVLSPQQQVAQVTKELQQNPQAAAAVLKSAVVSTEGQKAVQQAVKAEIPATSPSIAPNASPSASPPQ